MLRAFNFEIRDALHFAESFRRVLNKIIRNRFKVKLDENTVVTHFEKEKRVSEV